jgi:hypothetical protein
MKKCEHCGAPAEREYCPACDAIVAAVSSIHGVVSLAQIEARDIRRHRYGYPATEELGDASDVAPLAVSSYLERTRAGGAISVYRVWTAR